MGITSYIEARSSVESPARPLTDRSLIELMGGLPTYSGTSINVKSAVKFIAVYRAISLVSGVIASMPLEAKDGYESVKTRLLNNPHPDMTAMELWERVLWHLLLSGDSFSAKLRDRSGAIAYLDPYPIGSVTPKRVPRTARNEWGKEFEVRTDDGIKVLTPFDVLHVPGPGYEGESGLSPIGVARQGIGLGLAAEEFGARHFGNGSLITGILQTDQKLEKSTADELKRRWREKTVGMRHAHDVTVLDAGAKYVPIGLSPKDTQFIETRIQQVGEIARLYGIPLHLLAETSKSTSWGSGIAEQNIGLIIFTLGPWMSRIEQRVSKECLPGSLQADFDTAELRRGARKSQIEEARVAVESGLQTVNEARGDLRLPPIDGGDIRTRPGAWVSIDAEGNPVVVETPEEDPSAEATDEKVIPFPRKKIEARHTPGGQDHDQKLHGNWARNGAFAIPTEDSLHRHSDGQGNWSPERRALHDRLIQEAFAGTHPSPNGTDIYMTGGGSASGKTYALLDGHAAGFPDDVATIDPDWFKEKLPDYQDALAADWEGASSDVHEESSYISKQAIAYGIATGRDFIYDSTGDGDPGQLVAKIESFRAAGARNIVAAYATVPIDLALERAAARPRRVPEFIVRQAHEKVTDSLIEAIGADVFDEVNVYDTTTTATLIATFTKGNNRKIVLDAAWTAFVSKGKSK